MSKRYQQARKDYESLVAHHGNYDVDDLTGGFVSDDHFWEILRKPTKTEAAKKYEALIHYSFYAGFGDGGQGCIYEPDLENEQVREIYERYGCL